MEDVLVPLAFFGFLGAVIITPIYLNHKSRVARLDLVRQAFDKGHQVDAKLLESLYEGDRKPPADRARRTLGSGILLTALAVGLGIAAYWSGDLMMGNIEGLGVAAAIVGCLGLGFLALAVVDYASKPKNTPPEA